MSELGPCSGCGRHVRVEDAICPFCGGRSRARPFARRVARGATRAALFYVGATLAGCDDPGPAAIYGGPPVPPPEETIAQPYGAPPDPPPDPEDPPPEPEADGPQLPEE